MPNTRKLFYGAIFTVAAVLHVAAAADKGLWYDEVATASYAAKSFVELWRFLWTQDVHPPLFFWVEKIFSVLPLGAEWSLRLFPLLCSVLVVPLVEAITLRITGIRYWGALVAAFFPGLVVYGVEARAYAPLVFFQFAAFYGALRMRDEEDQLPWLAGSAAMLLIAMWMHYFALFFALPLGVYLFLWTRNKRLAAVVLLGAAVLYAPWLPRMIDTFFGDGTALQNAKPRFLVPADYWAIWEAHWGNMAAGVLALVAALYGAIRYRERVEVQALVTLFAFPVIVFFFFPPEYPIFPPRYLLTWAALSLPLVPAAVALSARLKWAGVALVVLTTGTALAANVNHVRADRVWNVEIGSKHTEFFDDGDVLIVDPFYQSLALLYYLPVEPKTQEWLLSNPLDTFDGLRLQLDDRLLAITSHDALVSVISNRKGLSGNMWLLSYGDELSRRSEAWRTNMTPIGRWENATLYRVTSPVRHDKDSNYLFLGSIPLGEFSPPEAPKPITEPVE